MFILPGVGRWNVNIHKHLLPPALLTRIRVLVTVRPEVWCRFLPVICWRVFHKEKHCPQMTQCGWQDVKIQELTRTRFRDLYEICRHSCGGKVSVKVKIVLFVRFWYLDEMWLSSQLRWKDITEGSDLKIVLLFRFWHLDKMWLSNSLFGNQLHFLRKWQLCTYNPHNY